MSDFLPLILLFLFGGFAVVSALLKTRARVKAPLGVVLTVLEGISGLVLMAASLPSSGSLETASRIGMVAAVLVAVSSTVHLLMVRERNRTREALVGRRLQAAIQSGVSDNPSVTGDEQAEPDVSTDLGDAGGRPGGTRS